MLRTSRILKAIKRVPPKEPSYQGIPKSEWLGQPTITNNSNAAGMRPKLIHALEEVEEIRPFLGKYTIRLAPDGAAVMDGSDCIAVYYFGESLVVDKAYRRQGIGEELVYQWRKQYPAKAKADTRTRASQALQEKVWDRLIRE